MMFNHIEHTYRALENYFYNYIQGHYPVDETPTFEEWFDGLSNSEVILYLTIGLDEGRKSDE